MVREISIRADKEEYEEASEDGCVFGTTIYYYYDKLGKSCSKLLFVYAELGKEVEILERNKRDIFTDKRKFVNCRVLAYLTQEDMDNGKDIDCLGQGVDVLITLFDKN